LGIVAIPFGIYLLFEQETTVWRQYEVPVRDFEGATVPLDQEVVAEFKRDLSTYEVVARFMQRDPGIERLMLDRDGRVRMQRYGSSGVTEELNIAGVKSLPTELVARRWNDPIRNTSEGVYFFHFRSGFLGGEVKGVAYLPTKPPASVEQSLDPYSVTDESKAIAVSDRYLYRRIDNHWYVFYQQSD
jgi:hypothetical protein